MSRTAQADQVQQLPLQRTWTRRQPRHEAHRFAEGRVGQRTTGKLLCAGCREREARYGFQDKDDPSLDRPSTLCFECFRMEIGRRQAVAARMARGWNAEQVRLPLEQKLKELTHRRRRAQIAARRAVGE
jgi:hypothetical protein